MDRNDIPARLIEIGFRLQELNSQAKALRVERNKLVPIAAEEYSERTIADWLGTSSVTIHNIKKGKL